MEAAQLRPPSAQVKEAGLLSVAEALSASSVSDATPAIAPRLLAVGATVSAAPETVRLAAPASAPLQASGMARVVTGGSHSVAPEAMESEASREVPRGLLL